MWKFDNDIANIYDEHVRQHIPNYELVIKKSCDVAIEVCKPADNICDFGCANGATLDKLNSLGFKNLYGVDTSIDMLNKCASKYHLSCSMFPNVKFKLILANWVVHFNHNKVDILKLMFNSLQDNGYFILSEKVSLNPFIIKQYYKIKEQNGVSKKTIKEKEVMLQGSMHVNNVYYYLKTFNELGFTEIEIIDASWGFATFFCRK